MSSPQVPEAFEETSQEPQDASGELSVEGPVSLAFRGAAPRGTAYRLVMETSGQAQVSFSTDRQAREPNRSSHAVELEYREAAVPREGAQASVLILDGLHVKIRQSEPRGEREIEAGEDRLRVMQDGQVAVDLQGTQPRENLTPRKMLDRVFAVVAYDELGNPATIQPRGYRVVRNFLRDLPLREAFGYTRVPRPVEPVAPGQVWRAEKFPANTAGLLGFKVDVEYSLAGYQLVDGVPCAWILLSADQDGTDVPSPAGFAFERAKAWLKGEAFLELATGRVRRLVIEDEVRAAYTRGDERGRSSRTRYRYRHRLLLEVRDPDEKPEKWMDGTERFSAR